MPPWSTSMSKFTDHISEYVIVESKMLSHWHFPVGFHYCGLTMDMPRGTVRTLYIKPIVPAPTTGRYSYKMIENKQSPRFPDGNVVRLFLSAESWLGSSVVSQDLTDIPLDVQPFVDRRFAR